MLKAAGFNAIRSAHNPISRADARRVRPARDARHGRDVRRVDRAASPTFDYSLAFPEWWERDVEAMVAQGLQPPERDPLLDRQRDPRDRPARRRRAGPRDSPSRSGRSTTPASSPTASTPCSRRRSLRRADAAESPTRRRAQHDDADDGRRIMHESASQTRSSTRAPRSRSPCSTSPGINYAESRYAMDRELFPHRVIVGSETFPRRIDRTVAAGRASTRT